MIKMIKTVEMYQTLDIAYLEFEVPYLIYSTMSCSKAIRLLELRDEPFYDQINRWSSRTFRVLMYHMLIEMV